MKELEEKEKEEIESKSSKTEKEEENEIELEPPSSLRPGRGFRPSTKREQIRMKLHQSKKKVWTFFNCLFSENLFSVSEGHWETNEETEAETAVPSVDLSC